MTLAPPVQDTYTVGEILTSASMNKNVRDAVNYLANPPIAYLYQSAAQSIPNSAWTSITYDAETVDTYAGHSNSTNPTRYVAQEAGWYLVSGSCSYTTGSGTGRRLVSFGVNGTLNLNTQVEIQVTGATTTPTSTALLHLNVGDYVELSTYQTSGASLPLNTTAVTMAVLWVHA